MSLEVRGLRKIFMITLLIIMSLGISGDAEEIVSMCEDDFFIILDDNSLFRWNNRDLDFTPITDNTISVSRQYAIKQDHSLWTWGSKTLFFDEINTNQTLVKLMDNVQSISGGYIHTLVVKDDKSLWGIGYNEFGELGQGEIAIDNEYCIPMLYKVPCKIMNNVKTAKVGRDHSIVLKTDGSVFTFGHNEYGQLGRGYKISFDNVPVKVIDNIKDIFAGQSSSFAIDNDSTLWRWGTNYGTWSASVEQTKSRLNVYEPIRYVGNVKKICSHIGFNLILKNDNSLWIYADTENSQNVYGIETPLKILDNVNNISEYSQDDSDKTIIITQNGDAMLFDIMKGEQDKSQYYIIRRIMDNVKLIEDRQDDNTKQFIDISGKSSEMQKAVTALSKAAIIDGVSETEFAPDTPITHAEIAALLLRMTARAEEVGNGGFVDVTSDKWYYNTAGASKKYGIISGYNDNTFRGDEPISNIQLISLVSRTLQCEKAVELKNKETKYNVPQWANTDTAIAAEQRLISEADISDSDIVTRGEAAVLLYRLYEKI